MNVIALRTLRRFWEKHPQAQTSLRAWHAVVRKVDWQGPQDVRATFRSADFVADNRVIFNVGGNKYRLVCHIAYRHRRVLVKFVGTHAEYDRIDASSV